MAGRMAKLEVIDRTSGEVMQPGMFVYVTGRKKIKEGFFMGFLESFEHIAKDPDLSGQPTRVFMYLLSKLDWENHIALVQADVAEGLGIGRNKVSEAMALLVRKGIVLQGPKLGRSASYRLNPHYGWRGSVSNLEKARAEHLRLVVDRSAAAAASAAADAVRDTLTLDMFEGK